MTENYITTSEVAALLQLKPNTIARWRTYRQSPFRWTKIGGRVLYDRAEVMAYVDQQKRNSVHFNQGVQ